MKLPSHEVHPASIADDGGSFETALASKPEGQTPALDARAAEINSLHDEILSHASSALEKAIFIGGLLAETKRSLPHGMFGAWMKANLRFSRSTAARYARCHENQAAIRLAVSSGAIEDFSTAIRFLAAPKTAASEPGDASENPTFPREFSKCVTDATFGSGPEVGKVQREIQSVFDRLDGRRAELVSIARELRGALAPGDDLETAMLACCAAPEPEAWERKFISGIVAEALS